MTRRFCGLPLSGETAVPVGMGIPLATPVLELMDDVEVVLDVESVLDVDVDVVNIEDGVGVVEEEVV